jgi:hypothetical protein
MPTRYVTVDRETPLLLPPDPGDWGPKLGSIAPAAGPAHEVLIDSGFCSEAAIEKVEHNDEGRGAGITVPAALRRKAHGQTVTDLENQADPPAPSHPRSGAPSVLNPSSAAMSGSKNASEKIRPINRRRAESRKNADAGRLPPKWPSHFELATGGRSPTRC